MEFILHYRGELPANAGAKTKHRLRRHFHQQLAELWNHPPLADCKRWLRLHVEEGETTICRKLGDFVFAPLITAQMGVYAQIHIDMLRPEPPGSLLAKGGDIDNRLKTLFDSMAMPPHINQIPGSVSPLEGESPFLCVLEDDKLISDISVQTGQLLEPDCSPREVILNIRVKVRLARATWDSIAFV